MDEFKIPTFLKWAGGKRRLLNDLHLRFPSNINRYFEPFLGGGSVFFFVKLMYNPSFCVISDTNVDLINAFKAVRDQPHILMRYLRLLKIKNSQDFYYKMRLKFNQRKILGLKRSAVFIYLNKVCYNGLYRVNSKNEFNVPYGKYKNPEIYNEKTILHASHLLQGVQIKYQDYREILKETEPRDFIYLDPCYDPIKRTSFVQYTPQKFCLIDRINLFNFVQKLKAMNAQVLLSNNDLLEVRRLYGKFHIAKIHSPRSINSDPKGRKKIIELTISNY